MINIKIQYRFLGIFRRILIREFPFQWNDLKSYMVLPFPKLIDTLFFLNERKKDKELLKLMHKKDKLSDNDLLELTEYDRLKLIWAFLGIKHKILFRFFDYQIKELLSFTVFLIKGKKILNKVIIPDFKLKRTQYFGPADRFENVSFGEFIIADTHFMNFINTGDDKFIKLLIACLYRPQNIEYDTDSPDYSGDIREKFNTKIIRYRSHLFRKLSSKTQDTILFNYKTIRKWLSQRYMYVFGTHVQDPVKEDPEQEQKPSSSWKEILKNLSPSILDIEKYATQNMHNVLEYLDDKILQGMKQN